jgi:hypothetical protein
MPGYFWMGLQSVTPDEKAIAFNLTIEQNNRRVARICSADFELWLVKSVQRNWRYLSTLHPDIRREVTNQNDRLIPEFKDQQKSSCRLLWHCTPEQLQQIEDERDGGNVLFYVYARFIVQAIWPHPNEAESVTHEVETPGELGRWPMLVEIAESDWVKLLSEVGFKHPIMDRLTWPSLPPAFSRAETHLNDAWNSYRRKQPESAMASCYKAFECLGFQLFGKEVERKEVLDLLMDGAEPEKQQLILAVLRALQNFYQLGRHDKAAPIKLNQLDAQTAVVCTTALLNYLASQQ